MDTQKPRGIIWAERLKKIFLALLVLFFAVEFAFSQSWRIVTDTPILHYGAFLIDRYGAVLYRDYFEPNMPLVFMIHLAIGKLFGYGDLAIKLIDSALLLLLMLMMGKLMLGFGRFVALTGAVLFGIVFLGYGPYMIMQRDYLGMFPILLSVMIAVNTVQIKGRAGKVLAIGALFGLSAAIKPLLIIGLPALIIFINWSDMREEAFSLPQRLRRITADHILALFAATLVFSIPLIWLWTKGGLGAYWDIVVNFYPLYSQVSPWHQPVTGMEKLVNSALAIQGLAEKGGLLIMAVLGMYLCLNETSQREQRRALYFLCAMLLIYFAYTVISAKFYPYHWMPYYMFLALLGGLIFYECAPDRKTGLRVWFPLLVFMFGVMTSLNPAKQFIAQWAGQNAFSAPYEKVDRMADYLRKHLREGDLVQPLGEMVSGSVHAMLIAEAKLATSYPLDRLIYNVASSDYLNRIRWRYIDQIMVAKPRFILRTWNTNKKGRPEDDLRFAALTVFLQAHYRVADEGSGYIIYALTSAPPSRTN